MPRRSKIATMPAPVRDWLEQVLIDGSHDGYHALAQMLREKGFEVSHASVHRYDQKVQRTIAAIKTSTEAARQITASLPDQSDDVSQGLLRMVQSQMFQVLVSLQESAGEADLEKRIKVLSTAVRSASEAARANVTHRRWQDEVKARLAALESEAGKGKGKRLDAATLAAVREALYGG